MPGWRDRAKPVSASGGWKSRAKPVTSDMDLGIADVSAPRELSNAEILAGGNTQGATSGLVDEASGAINALFGKRELPLEANGLTEDQTFADRYREGRDSSRQYHGALKNANETLYDAGELFGGVAQTALTGPLLKAAGVGAKGVQVANSGALQGGLNAFGHAEGSAAEQAAQTAMGVGAGHLLEKGGKWLGSKFRSLADKFRGITTDASDEMIAAAQKAKDKAVRSAGSGMGGEAADIIRSQEVVEKAADKLAAVDPTLAAELKSAATDPAALERYKSAAKNYAPRLKDGAQAYAAKEAELAAAKAIDPIAEASKRGAKDVFLSDKSKKYYLNQGIRQALPVAGGVLGGAMGGEDHRTSGGLIGTTAGTVGALMTGHGGTKLINDLRSPEVRKIMGKGGEWLAEKAGEGVEHLIRPMITRELTDDDAKFQWLKAKLEALRK